MPRRTYADDLEDQIEEDEREAVVAVLCGRWKCSPDEIAEEDIAREMAKREEACE